MSHDEKLSPSERRAKADAEADMEATGFAAKPRHGFARYQCPHPPDRADTRVDDVPYRHTRRTCGDCGTVRDSAPDPRYSLPLPSAADVEPPPPRDQEHLDANRDVINNERQRSRLATDAGKRRGTFLNRYGYPKKLDGDDTDDRERTAAVLKGRVGVKYTGSARTVEAQAAAEMYRRGHRHAIVVTSRPPWSEKPPGRGRPSAEEQLDHIMTTLNPGATLAVIGPDGATRVYPQTEQAQQLGPEPREPADTAQLSGRDTMSGVDDIRAAVANAGQHAQSGIAAAQQAIQAFEEAMNILVQATSGSHQPEVEQAHQQFTDVISRLGDIQGIAQNAISAAESYANHKI